jgi:hypothetical protein
MFPCLPFTFFQTIDGISRAHPAYIRRFSDHVSFYSELLNGAGGLGLNQFLESRGHR